MDHVMDMEVIDTGEGSVEASDVALSKAEAELLTTQIRTSLHHAQELIVLAWQGRVWDSMGYASWDEYVAAEFADISLRPPLESRADTVTAMRGAGMSIRAISAATTLSVGTVSNALKEAHAREGVSDGVEATPVVGLDGKAYQPRQEPREKREMNGLRDFEVPEDLLDRPAEEFGVKAFVPSQVPNPVRKIAEESALPGLEEPRVSGRDRSEDFGLDEAQVLVDRAYEAVKASIEKIGNERSFPVEAQSNELVRSMTDSLLISAGLLERLGLVKERVGDHVVVVSHLQIAAATLDRVADQLGGEADE